MKLFAAFLFFFTLTFFAQAQQGMGAGGAMGAGQARMTLEQALQAELDGSLSVEDRFRKAYSLYQTGKAAFEAGEFDRTSLNYDFYAQQAYELGKQLFADDDLNRMNLAFNLGEALIERRDRERIEEALNAYRDGMQIAITNFGERSEQLIPVYQRISEAFLYADREGREEHLNYRLLVLQIAEENYGDDAPELIPFLVDVGEAKNRFTYTNQLSDFRRAIAISKRVFGDNSPEAGLLTLRIGQLLYKFSSNQTLRYLKDAIDLLELYPDQSYSLGLAYLNLGKTYLWEDHRSADAEQSFAKALYSFEAAPADEDTYFVEVVARALLIASLERQEKFAEADRQVQYIKFDDAVTMGFVDGIIYAPISYIGDQYNQPRGAVEVLFEVGKDGRVKEHRYQQMEGYDLPPDSILEDIESGLYARRYAPKWEKGELIEFASRYRYVFD